MLAGAVAVLVLVVLDGIGTHGTARPYKIDPATKAPLKLLNEQRKAGNITTEQYVSMPEELVSRSAHPADMLVSEGNGQFPFYYLHIPKVAGYSIAQMLNKHGCSVAQLGTRGPTAEFNNWAKLNPNSCVIMTEGQGFNERRPPHSVVMLREPTAHVISQYMHCKESVDHKKWRGSMPPTLKEWLSSWDSVRRMDPAYERKTSLAMHHWHDPKFQCYVPINLQSWLIGYPTSKEEFASMFSAVGTLDQLGQTVCVFLVTLLGRVPGACDCSTREQRDPETQKKPFSHGVKHHGGSYNGTAEELRMIEELTLYDAMLYRYAEEILSGRIRNIERKYHVKLCDEPMIQHTR